jgi:hypothetical protein
VVLNGYRRREIASTLKTEQGSEAPTEERMLSAAKLLGTEKIAFFALSNCELMALVAEERIIHALKSGLFDAARESVPVEEYFPKSIYGLVSNKSGYCLHRF